MTEISVLLLLLRFELVIMQIENQDPHMNNTIFRNQFVCF